MSYQFLSNAIEKQARQAERVEFQKPDVNRLASTTLGTGPTVRRDEPHAQRFRVGVETALRKAPARD